MCRRARCQSDGEDINLRWTVLSIPLTTLQETHTMLIERSIVSRAAMDMLRALVLPYADGTSAPVEAYNGSTASIH